MSAFFVDAIKQLENLPLYPLVHRLAVGIDTCFVAVFNSRDLIIEEPTLEQVTEERVCLEESCQSQGIYMEQ